MLAAFDGRAAAAQFHSSRVYFIDTETPSPVRAHGRRHVFTPLGFLVQKFSTVCAFTAAGDPKKISLSKSPVINDLADEMRLNSK